MAETYADDRVPSQVCTHRDEETGIDCTGNPARGFDRCLAHLEPDHLCQVLQRLRPGAELDLSGTPIEGALLAQIVDELRDEQGRPVFGSISFTRARFTGAASFDNAQFTEGTSFDNAEFTGEASFDNAWFAGYTGFKAAQFAGTASFNNTQFTGEQAVLDNARFTGAARFDSAQFTGTVSFEEAHFSRDAIFVNAQLAGKTHQARFDNAQFAEETKFDSAQFAGYATFQGAQFAGPASFNNTQFTGEQARFDNAQFTRDASFDNARFTQYTGFGDAQFTGREARFDNAQFTGDARFDNANFTVEWAMFENTRFAGYAVFGDAQFTGPASFKGAQFTREEARFDKAQFNGGALFEKTRFSRDVSFVNVQYNGYASFKDAQFKGIGWFQRTKFAGQVSFDNAQFSKDALFDNVRFEETTVLGPLVAESLSLYGAFFARGTTIQAAAVTVSCNDARWEAAVTLQLRYATVILERATFTEHSFLAGVDRQFKFAREESVDHAAGQTGWVQVDVDDDHIRARLPTNRRGSLDAWMPILPSLQGVDAAKLSVTDVDLSPCLFAGARHLDQLRLEGRCIFDHPPRGVQRGWAWPPVWRWSSRQSLVEERIWRATRPRYRGWASTRSGQPADVRPERLAALYRQLRKAQEDAKNEPGAADFYYGEMEMRRHTRATRVAEHAIIWLYWLISGYGLRALRSLAALAIVGVIVTTALVGWGLAADAPSQQLTGTVTNTLNDPARIDATLHTTPAGLPPVSQRWTRNRTRTSLQIALESIVFRSTNQPLTTVGTWTTIAARILGPVLLALTLFAVRSRIRR